MIRRSDDALTYQCSTADGREAEGSIQSEIEGGKMAASVIFWDLGITDSITDKHRTYQGNVVIPVQSRDDVATNADTSTAEISRSGGSSVESRLKQLQSLKDQRLISDEEYNTRRAEILQDL